MHRPIYLKLSGNQLSSIAMLGLSPLAMQSSAERWSQVYYTADCSPNCLSGYQHHFMKNGQSHLLGIEVCGE